MKRNLQPMVVALTCVLVAPMVFGQTDQPGSRDYPGISRMPGYYISSYKESQFDSFAFTTKEGGKEKKQAVEGKRYDFRYDAKKDAGLTTTSLQILRNYQNAARSAGGQVLYEYPDGSAVTRQHPPSAYYLTIIEKQAMQQEVAADANAMAHDLDETGRVALHGIHFDTGKSELKPDSEPALIEIAKLLKLNPALKVYIVGHTDMTADLAINMKLSQTRAQSVVNALVAQYGVGSSRLIAFGAGPYAPVASNKTEEGRAKNRRVELVEIATN